MHFGERVYLTNDNRREMNGLAVLPNCALAVIAKQGQLGTF